MSNKIKETRKKIRQKIDAIKRAKDNAKEKSKKFVDVLSELNTFGSNLNIRCNENVLELNASGESAKIKVNIPIDELNEFAIEEDGNLNISFSLNHLCKMCTL